MIDIVTERLLIRYKPRKLASLMCAAQ